MNLVGLDVSINFETERASRSIDLGWKSWQCLYDEVRQYEKQQALLQT